MKCSTNRCRSNVFEDLDRGLSHLFHEVMRPDAVASEDPRISVYECSGRYVVECDVPGISLDDITVQLEENVLSISGTRESASRAENDNLKVIMNERSSAKFLRHIRLARDVDRTSVDAALRNGVLTIVVPMRPEVLPRKIEIKRA